MDLEEIIDNIQKNDLTELKSYASAPPAVKMVLEAVCILKGVKPKNKDYWLPSKAMMSEPDFLKSLKTFDKDKVPAEKLELIRTKYLSNRDFDSTWLRQVSVAGEWLCKWVIAIAEE